MDEKEGSEEGKGEGGGGEIKEQDAQGGVGEGVGQGWAGGQRRALPREESPRGARKRRQIWKTRLLLTRREKERRRKER